MPHKSALCFRLWSEFIQRILYCVKKNISLADSAAVLQHISNADKYPMTPQGIFNADFDGA